MNRWWTALPIAGLLAVPVWTAPSTPVIVIEAVGCLVAALGVYRFAKSAVVSGCVIGLLGYTFAVWSEGRGVDVIGSAIFGFTVLSLLDLSEFGRRFDGAAVAPDVVRAQVIYWLGRAAVVAVAVAALAALGYALSMLVPGGGRAIIAGAGALLAFGGALGAGITRRPGDFVPNG